MMIRAYLLLCGAVLFNVSSYVIYRSIAVLTARYWWPFFGAGLALGAVNALLFVRAINVVPLSIAYPVFSAASFALIAAIAAAAFGEKLLPMNIAGLVVVMVGIALVAYAP
jgi:multidrug transporter EmrE-like cation transporter